jgi:membrane protein DedA with SNARE-associated domain
MHGSMLPAAVHLLHHPHHYFTGPHIDYIGLALAAALSWVGVTGPGEAALIAAGIVATHGRVDLVGVIMVAWLGAMTGGTAGWLIGLKGGRSFLTRPGPLHRFRLRLVRHGDDIYRRRGWLAVYLAPSWMAGISAMPASRFLPANALAGLVWSLAIGLGSYLAGPSVADAISEIGTIGLVALALLAVLATLARRRSRRRHSR